MTIIQLLSTHLNRLHNDLEQAIHGLSEAQLHFRPEGECNHIAFCLWHYVRTEDNLVRFVLQKRRPTVWLEYEWDKKFTLDRVSQGTGMDLEQAATIHLPSVRQFTPYIKAVNQSTRDYMMSLSDTDLKEEFLVRPMGQRTVLEILTENLLTHGFSHLGEIWALRGLQGLKGSPI